MTTNEYEVVLGRVLRASTRGFDFGAHSRNILAGHDFGGFVKATISNETEIVAIGLIYKVEIKDDQLISELVLGGELADAILLDQRNNRLIPVEIKVLNVGYAYMDSDPLYCVHSVPPRPPMSLSDVSPCSEGEIYDFTRRLDFFRIVLQAAEVPSDDLIAAAIRCAGSIYKDTVAKSDFYVACGRRLARDLSNDMKRLSHILSLINPYLEGV